MKRLLVTGASGFLGWNLCQVAQRDWEVYGVYHSKPFQIPGVTPVQADLTNFDNLKQLFQTVKPDAVAHLAALSSPNACQNQPEVAYAINVTASWNLAGLSADAGIPCVFTSSDMVFDGRNPPYRETDPVCPVNRYGEHKSLAETGMLERYPRAAICRMPLMFGFAATAPSFLQPFIQQLRQGQELRLFIDEFRTPVGATTAAQGLLLALEQVSGRLHLGGKERVSRYEFGKLMVDALQLPDDRLYPCRQADVPMPAPRPPDLSMDSTKAFTLGYTPLSIYEELLALRGKV